MISSAVSLMRSNQKLKTVRPKTLGQALRIDGVTPAAAIILLGYIKSRKKGLQLDN